MRLSSLLFASMPLISLYIVGPTSHLHHFEVFDTVYIYLSLETLCLQVLLTERPCHSTSKWRFAYAPSRYYEYNRSRSSSPLRSRLPFRRVTDIFDPLDPPSQQANTARLISVDKPIQNETSRRPPPPSAKQTPYRLPWLFQDRCPACVYPP